MEQLFTPTERTMTAQAANSIKNRFPQYVWGNADIARTTRLDPGVKRPISNACFRKPQWKFPTSLIDPLIWYWTRLDFYNEPGEVPPILCIGVYLGLK